MSLATNCGSPELSVLETCYGDTHLAYPNNWSDQGCCLIMRHQGYGVVRKARGSRHDHGHRFGHRSRPCWCGMADADGAEQRRKGQECRVPRSSGQCQLSGAAADADGWVGSVCLTLVKY